MEAIVLLALLLWVLGNTGTRQTREMQPVKPVMLIMPDTAQNENQLRTDSGIGSLLVTTLLVITLLAMVA